MFSYCFWYKIISAILIVHYLDVTIQSRRFHQPGIVCPKTRYVRTPLHYRNVRAHVEDAPNVRRAFPLLVVPANVTRLVLTAWATKPPRLGCGQPAWRGSKEGARSYALNTDASPSDVCFLRDMYSGAAREGHEDARPCPI